MLSAVLTIAALSAASIVVSGSDPFGGDVRIRQRRLQTSVASLQSLVNALRSAIPDEDDPAFVRFYKRYCAPKETAEAVSPSPLRRSKRHTRRSRFRRDADSAAKKPMDDAAAPSNDASRALNLFPEEEKSDTSMNVGSALSLIGGELNQHSHSIKRLKKAMEKLATELMATTDSLGNTDGEFSKFAQQMQALADQQADRIVDLGAQLRSISMAAMDRDQTLEQMIYNLTDMTSNIRMIAQEQEEAIKELRSTDSHVHESVDDLRAADGSLRAADQKLKDEITLLRFNISGLVLMAEIHGNDLLTQREEINLLTKTVEDHANRIGDLEELDKLDRKLRQEQENRLKQLFDSTKDLKQRMGAAEKGAADMAKGLNGLESKTADLASATQALKAADSQLMNSVSQGSNNADELLALIREQSRQIKELKEEGDKLKEDDNKLAQYLAESQNKTDILTGLLELQKQRLDGFKSDQVGLEGKLLDLGETVENHGGALKTHAGHIDNIKKTRDDDFKFLSDLHSGVKGHVNVSLDDLNRRMGHMNSAIQGLKSAVRKDCPEGFIPAPPGMFSCYKFLLMPNTQADARAACKDNGADLVAIESPDEHKFLSEYIKDRPGLRTRSYWTSGTDQQEEAHWIWQSTDQPITGYTKWSPAEPNGARVENCLELRASFGFNWNDLICTNPLGAICEYTYPARK